MDQFVTDHLEGNPAAQETRARYRELLAALAEHEPEKFACRFELKLREDNTCVLLVTSSKGEAFDMAMCNVGLTLLYSLTGTQPPKVEE